jgi:hypothetical protein
MPLVKKDFKRASSLIFWSIVLIVVVGSIAFRMEKKKNPDLTVKQFLSLSPFPSTKSIMTGMASGLVFGFIDNAGLWFGMDALDPHLPKGPLTKAGLGNTYSDAVGSFLGTFAGVIIQNMTGIKEVPIWSEAVGVVMGCLLGILIPRALTGKT